MSTPDTPASTASSTPTPSPPDNGLSSSPLYLFVFVLALSVLILLSLTIITRAIVLRHRWARRVANIALSGGETTSVTDEDMIQPEMVDVYLPESLAGKQRPRQWNLGQNVEGKPLSLSTFPPARRAISTPSQTDIAGDAETAVLPSYSTPGAMVQISTFIAMPSVHLSSRDPALESDAPITIQNPSQSHAPRLPLVDFGITTLPVMKAAAPVL